MSKQQSVILETKKHIGGAYSQLKWLTPKEAKEATKKRDKLLRSIAHKIKTAFLDNKIYLGKLSPGCRICGAGYWSCLFINSLCTADCFYCPQDRRNKKESLPTDSKNTFDSPEEYVEYLKKFGFRGVGFSGGEPLLVFDKLISFIKKIREEFGKDFYIWMYTNGDLVDREKLKILKTSGLNEIRFDISARGYNLQPINLAAKIINTVTVEIPAIPEDYRKVTKILKALEKMGVRHLNLHQLNSTEHNYKQFLIRKYTFLHQGIAIFESEITALRIIQYVLDKKIPLSVNYCTQIYKNRFQGKGERERILLVIKNTTEEITKAGFLRSLCITSSVENIKKLMKHLKNKEGDNGGFLSGFTNTEMFIHSRMLKYIDTKTYNFKLSYFTPQFLEGHLPAGAVDKSIVLDSGKKIYINKYLVYEYKALSPVMLETFKRIFVENGDEGEAYKYFYKNNLISLSELRSEMRGLANIKNYEYLPSGLSDIY